MCIASWSFVAPSAVAPPEAWRELMDGKFSQAFFYTSRTGKLIQLIIWFATSNSIPLSSSNRAINSPSVQIFFLISRINGGPWPDRWNCMDCPSCVLGGNLPDSGLSARRWRIVCFLASSLPDRSDCTDVRRWTAAFTYRWMGTCRSCWCRWSWFAAFPVRCLGSSVPTSSSALRRWISSWRDKRSERCRWEEILLQRESEQFRQRFDRLAEGEVRIGAIPFVLVVDALDLLFLFDQTEFFVVSEEWTSMLVRCWADLWSVGRTRRNTSMFSPDRGSGDTEWECSEWNISPEHRWPSLLVHLERRWKGFFRELIPILIGQLFARELFDIDGDQFRGWGMWWENRFGQME